MLICAFIVFLSAISFLSTQTTYCKLCHLDEVRNWANSSHKELSCQFCHQRPGVIGLFEQRIRAMNMLFATFNLSRYSPAYVQSSFCLDCHNEISRGVIKGEKVKVRHSDFLNEGYKCVYCHSAVVHGDSIKTKKEINMDKCLECHDGSRASAKCTICHIKRIEKASDVNSPYRLTHDQGTWSETHGLGKQASCQVCHARGFCARCHKIPLPHQEFWLNIHGKEAIKAEESCIKCHNRTLCEGCHRIKMPHPKGFLPSHSQIVKKEGTEACYSCHIESSCKECHISHIHPGLASEQIKALRKKLIK